MSEQVKCDLCGKTGATGQFGVSGWMEVGEYGAGHHRSLRDNWPNLPIHVCSFGCLTLWGIKYRDLIEQPRPVTFP